jgi:hypothetical protein
MEHQLLAEQVVHEPDMALVVDQFLERSAELDNVLPNEHRVALDVVCAREAIDCLEIAGDVVGIDRVGHSQDAVTVELDALLSGETMRCPLVWIQSAAETSYDTHATPFRRSPRSTRLCR